MTAYTFHFNVTDDNIVFQCVARYIHEDGATEIQGVKCASAFLNHSSTFFQITHELQTAIGKLCWCAREENTGMALHTECCKHYANLAAE